MKSTALKVDSKILTLQELFEQAGVQDKVPRIGGITIHPEIVPMDHQLGDLNNAMVYGRWGFLSDPGTGKSFPAQAFALFNAAYGWRSILLMPPVLLPQFRRSLYRTFQGSEERFSLHILNQPAYPIKLTKKRVQRVRRAMAAGEDPGIPEKLANLVEVMGDTKDIPFTQEEIAYIRASPRTARHLAMEIGCQQGAVSNLRRKTFKEDLFALWAKDGSWPDLLLMSYQTFLAVNKRVEPYYRCMIADEAHMSLCHPSSMTYKKVRRFIDSKGEGESAFVPMTGTPIPNVPTDAYGIISLVYPEGYSSLKEFESFHVDKVRQTSRDGKRQWDIVTGYKNLEMLNVNLFARASRSTKEQVLSLDRPQIIEKEVVLGDEHYALYRKLVRERVLEVNGETISAVQAQSLRQKALQIVTNPDPFSDRPIQENSVRDMLLELLEEVGCLHHEKVVIYAIYNKSIEAMSKWMEQYRPAIVYGKTNSAENVERFKTDPSCRVMIAHYKSGGVGIDGLQNFCRYVICAEPTSVPGEFTQATERVYRKGQKKVVTFFVLSVLGTGWPKQVASMRRKASLEKQVTLEKSSLLAELLGED